MFLSIGIIVVCLLIITLLVNRLIKDKKKLMKYSPLIPLEEQMEKMEIDIARIKKSIDTETKKLLKERDDSINEKNNQLQSITESYNSESRKLADLKKEKELLESSLKEMQDEQNLIECSFYSPRYNLENSEKHKVRLDEIKERQKILIREKCAIKCDTKWLVSGSEKEGQRMTDQNIKLGLSSYNGQIDNIILTVTYKNTNKSKEKIDKVRDSINKMMDSSKCYVTDEYHQLKVEELYLSCEYEKKLYEEKEEQKEIRLRMQEEERELRALQKAKEDAEKEEREFSKELARVKKELEKGHTEEKEELEKRILELESKLAITTENKNRAESMAMKTKRGHVYIISNIGSFGENIYKIGLTRRINPQERIDELGDASVPFSFDVHGMIFSENAPALEKELHDSFELHSVNKINPKKEFFEIPINKIQDFCNEKGLKIELTKIAEAREYRQSMQIKKDNEQKTI